MRITTIKDDLSLDQLCSVLSNGLKYISYDIEVMNDEPGKMSNLEDWHPSSRVVSASFTFDYHYLRPPTTWVIPLSHPVSPFRDRWREVLTRIAESMTGAKLIGHNLKFDLRWTYSMTGIALDDRAWFDTMAAAYAVDENERKSLKEVAPRYLGVQRWDDVDLRDAERVPWRDLGRYNAYDTLYTWQLVKPLMDEMKEDKRVARIFHYVLMPSIRSLLKVERNGLKPDGDLMKDLRITSNDNIEIAERQLLVYVEKFLGEVDESDTNWSPSSKFFRAFMEKSGAPVYKSSPKTGKPSWDKEVLNRLADEGAQYVKSLLAYRESTKTISFLDSWEKFAKFDGRLHPSFNPFRLETEYGDELGTVTGRLSSSNPNAQQIPRALKRVFVPEAADWLFVEADFAQIEMRLGAQVYQESNMIEALERGDDLHTLLAAQLTDKTPEEVTPAERQHAKAGNFGFLYGMGAEGFIAYARAAYQIDVDLGEATKIRQAFFSQWSELENGHDRILERARANGYVVSPLGRLRRLPDLHSNKGYLRGRAERQAINSPVQSFASDLMLLTIIDLTKELDSEEAQIVGTVHDSILLEIRKDQAKKILMSVADKMLYPDIKRRFGAEITVPLAVEFKIGKRWADANAKTIEVTSHG